MFDGVLDQFFINIIIFDKYIHFQNHYSIVPVKIETKYNHKYMNDESITFVDSGPRDVLLNVTFSVIKPFPREARTRITVQKESGKKYVDFGPPLERNMCDFIKNDKMIYHDVLNYSNFPKSCPIVAKEYHVINYRLPVNFLPPILPVGNYKIILQHKLKNDMLYEATIFGKIVQQ